MTSKTVKLSLSSIEADEGDGAVVRRSIGRPEVTIMVFGQLKLKQGDH